ncbi:unnamed protein product [Phytophthora lilii]|uniref:Unnamed protein product n=1 Tax=Phytophthora lilii TaxID=2077276 RepID=A0A9W6X0C8_9STRA|nr:unnamed protein product [Phytophthora lilii]
MNAFRSEKSALEERLSAQQAQLEELQSQQHAAVAALEEEKRVLASEVSELKSSQSTAVAQCSEKEIRCGVRCSEAAGTMKSITALNEKQGPGGRSGTRRPGGDAWLLVHYTGSEVPVSVVEAAAGHGQLDVLRFLLVHDASRAERQGWRNEEDIQNTVTTRGDTTEEGPKEKRCIVRWGRHDMRDAARGGHSKTVRWLYQRTASFNEERGQKAVIECALDHGDVSLVVLANTFQR